jgi:hypothetical protein
MSGIVLILSRSKATLLLTRSRSMYDSTTPHWSCTGIEKSSLQHKLANQQIDYTSPLKKANLELEFTDVNFTRR